MNVHSEMMQLIHLDFIAEPYIYFGVFSPISYYMDLPLLESPGREAEPVVAESLKDLK